MDRTSSLPTTPVERQLAHLKILSRLLGHELHAQTGARLSLSRDEVTEIQTSLDLFIEGVMQTRRGGGTVPAEMDVETVPARVN